jgi:6-phosphogluconolactonase
MQPQVHIFNSPSELANNLAEIFYNDIGELTLSQHKVTIALSGGSTPLLLFKKIATRNSLATLVNEWNKVHIYWCDERCVPPHHPDSNYGMANRYLLRALNIKDTNIHRIHGEDEPVNEAIRYGEEVRNQVITINSIPVFDWIFLGMGEDGHTASVFPDQISLLYSDAICAVATHPVTGQQRITLTGKPLIHAKRISFIVTGSSKAQRIQEIFQDKPAAGQYPARYIKPLKGRLEWYLDKEAATMIRK